MKTFKVVKYIYEKKLGGDLKTLLLNRKQEVIAEHLSWKDAKEKRKEYKEAEIIEE